jgi:hypothetical protein
VDSQEQIRQFLETLFPDLAENEQINVRPDIPEGYQAEGFINFFWDSIDEAVVACLRLREIGAHAYVSVNPRDRDKVEAEEGKGTKGSPGGKSTVSRVIAVFSDYDYAKMGQSRDEALEYLQSLSCPPTMFVDSGGGLQPYWLLVDPVTSTEDKALAEKIMAGMCDWWQTDKVKDYSRILRVPGTLNVKPEYETPRECFIEQSDNGARYSLDELWEMVPEEYHTPQKSVSLGPNGSHPPKEGRPLDPPDLPLGVGDGRHLKATRVIGYFASLKTKGGWPLPVDEVRRNSETWFENPNNCTAPLHTSNDPEERKDWERMLSDFTKDRDEGPWGERAERKAHTYGENEEVEPFSPESDPPHKGFGEKETEGRWTLPTKSLEQVIDEAGEETDWIIVGLLARGDLTVFSGRAKKSGKTTFWWSGMRACAEGVPHAGLETRPARFLYLTEQGNNITQALKDSGFIDPDTGAIAHGNSVEVVQFKDVSSVPWEKLVRESAAYAGREGFDALIVDTSATFTRLKGEQENQAPEVGERVRAMRVACQQEGIAGVLLRHSGKDGHGRGSSAFEDEADICVELTRPDGNHGPTVRKIDVFGRHGMWETNIQLRNRRFFGLGGDNAIEFNRAVEEVRRVLRDVATKEDGLLRSEIEERIDEDVGKGTLDRALTWLEEELGEIRRERSEGRGRPYVYWRPDPLDFFSPNPPTGGECSGEKEPDEENSAYTSPNGSTSFSPEGSVGEAGEKEEERNGGYTPGMSKEEFRALIEVWDEQSGPWPEDGDPSEVDELTSEAADAV